MSSNSLRKLNVGLTRQRLWISYLKYAQRAKGNYGQQLKTIIRAVYEQTENINKEICYKKEIDRNSGTENTMPKMKNSLDSSNSKSEQSKEKVSKLNDRAIELIPLRNRKEK